MKIRSLYLSAALPVLTAATSLPSFAQVSITDARTTPIVTSTAATDGSADDVTITSTGSVVVTSGVAVTLDSDNSVTNAGEINTLDVNDTTGILVSGSVTGAITNTGSIELSETFPTAGIVAGGDIAQGSGRVGILISGGSSFTGDLDNQSASSITINGQDSAGIRLANTATMTGDILQAGGISVYGERSTAIDILGDVIGNLAISGSINASGEDSHAVHTSGDISGGISLTSAVSTSAFVTATGTIVALRPSLANRNALISAGSVRQVGAAIDINGNVGNGVFIEQIIDEDTGVVSSVGTVSMFGSAPAILIDGNGTPIALGRVGPITDPTDTDFDEDLQYAFINQGTLSANAVLDDKNATTLSLLDATLEGGLRNTGRMESTVYRSGVDPDATAATSNSHARVILIGGGAIAERINNTGTIIAAGFDATDSIYADADNVLAANTIYATAIDIDANGSLSEIANFGTITALITGRDGEAVAIRDSSGTLTTINNSGLIQSGAVTSDAADEQATNFNLVAIDVSANTSGVTLNQTVFTDPDTEVSSTPIITGSVLLGSGDDTLNIAGGVVVGDTISFGDGADTLNISNSSTVTASILDSDGQLDIIVTDGSRLNVTGASDIDVSSASFDDTSIYSPFIDPSTGDVSTLVASGAVTFEDGAVIAPILSTVLNDPSAVYTIAETGTLNINADLGSLRSDQTPYLYNTTFSRSPSDANTLIMTVDVRSTQELGLDNVQAGLFTSAFEALQNSDLLGAEFVGITSQTDFNSAFNQLLPEFASASRQFVMANVDGATGAVGAHLNNARRSQDRPGGAWIEQFAYYADRSLANLSEQYRGYGFGITGGFDTSFGPFHTVGINAGFATTEVEDVIGTDDPMDVLTVQLGTYAGFQTGNLGIDLYGGIGYNDFETQRNVVIGNFNETAQADWSGVHYNGSISAGYDISFGNKFFVRPSATATYLSLKEKGYTEEGSSGIELAIDDRTVNTATGSLMLDIGAKFEKERSWFAPSMRVGLRNEFVNDGVITTGRFINGATNFLLESEEFPNTGILLGITFAAGSRYSSFSFDLDSDIRDGYNRHTARLVLRLLF